MHSSCIYMNSEQLHMHANKIYMNSLKLHMHTFNQVALFIPSSCIFINSEQLHKNAFSKVAYAYIQAAFT